MRINFCLLYFLLMFASINSASIRHELTVEDEALIYYLEPPEQVETYPILLAIEGSYAANRGPTSVLRLHEKLSPEILSWNVGLMTLERRGADNKNIDKDKYHYYNTP